MKPPAQLLLVAQKLGPLRERVVFVGGMIRGLLTTDPAAGPMRPTDDVDLIVPNLASISDYHSLGADLRKLGFQEDTRDGAPVCRWTVDGVTADVMPIDPAVLGFSNIWYESAQHHVTTTVTTGGELRHLDAPHFCATKLEAFASRGAGDLYHHDLEDFIALVDERPTLVAEITSAPRDVLTFIAERVHELLAMPAFVEALPGHVGGDDASQGRLPAIINKLQLISALIGEQAPAASAHLGPSHTRVLRAPTRTVVASQPLVLRAPPASTGRIHVRSSNLAWIEYFSEERRLLVGFRSGASYSYANVPAGTYQGLRDAYSKGRFFHVWIKNRYAVRIVRG